VESLSFSGAVKSEEEIAKTQQTPGVSDKPLGSVGSARSAGPSKLTSPSQKFGNFLNAYAKSINHAYDRTGSLFQQRFGRKEVTSDAHFLHLIAYIHRNPEKHGFADDFCDWPYSSYQAFLSQKSSRLKRDEVLAWLGEGVQGDAKSYFVEFHRDEFDETRIAPLIADDFD